MQPPHRNGRGRQTSVLAIRNVTVVPATGGPSMPATTVLIRGDRITVIGPANSVTIPAEARVVDGTHKS